MDSQHTAVEVSNVSHSYGEKVALDSVSFSIPRGATMGLIGPDGVGKSTLLSLMAGVKIIQEGSVQVLGRDMAKKVVRDDLSQHIAFMPQGLGHNLPRRRFAGSGFVSVRISITQPYRALARQI